MNKWLLSLLIFCCATGFCQDTTGVATAPLSPSVLQKRKLIIGSVVAAGYGGSFLFLSQAWYKDYPRTGFHTFNDAGEWLQMDKAGHAWTAYHTTRLTTNFWRWAGVPQKRALAYGAGSSLLYMLAIEYLDGRSTQWGWSWGDVGADFFGASLLASQQLSWKEDRISLKFSSHPKTYAGADLQKRADDLFGASFQSRLLKDYNAQTYWLSANIRSFFPQTKLPRCFNVAIGYGAEDMFGGYENIALNKSDGTVTFDRRDIKRYRQFYLAPDVDLTKIKTRSKFLQSVFSALNVLKFPAPAMELSKGRLQFRWIAY